MARLLHVTVEDLRRTRSGFGPPPEDVDGFRARRPRAPGGPWFEVTPAAPSFDSRIERDDTTGVAAWLETFGGVTGPLPARLREHVDGGAAVLGGAVVPPGTPMPDRLELHRRDSGLRLSLRGGAAEPGRQALILATMFAPGPLSIQLALGSELRAEPPIFGDCRVAVLVDLPVDEAFVLDLRLRMCAFDRQALLAVSGVHGHLL